MAEWHITTVLQELKYTKCYYLLLLVCSLMTAFLIPYTKTQPPSPMSLQGLYASMPGICEEEEEGGGGGSIACSSIKECCCCCCGSGGSG